LLGIAGRLLWANPGRLIVLVAGAVSVALATSGIVLAASTSLAVVRQTVDAGWRGSYDLLVRPADVPSLVVDGRDLVPLDYLGLRSSGITREQWERIAGLANVEVAAPVAAVGWLKNYSPDVGVELRNVRPGVVYRIEVKVQIAGQEAVNANGLFAAPTAGQDPLTVGLGDTFGSAPDIDIGLASLPATWGLVVGIDPSAEDTLMGLSGYTEGTFLSSGTYRVDDAAFGRSAVAVPVLTAGRSPVPGELSVTLWTVDGLTPGQVVTTLESDPPQSLAELEDAIQRAIAMGSSHRLGGDAAPLNELLHPLRPTAITLGADGRLRVDEELGGGFASDNNVLLLPSLANYEPSSIAGADLTLRPRGTWQELIDPQLDAALPPNWYRPSVTFGGDETVYRDLKVSVPPAFTLVPLGTYDREAINERFAAAANDAPLGIYSDVPRTLLEDASAQPIDAALAASINPAGLNPQPPIGLTNLEAAEALRGDRFIDAVRVRVAGITGYTPEAVRRIETVAQQIVEATGLHVDVVAGSSPVDLRVAVPGVGIVSERWTTLGTAAQIVAGAEGLSGALLGAALLVVLAYLAAFGTFLTGEQAAELKVLSWVGWRPRSLVALVAIQAAALGMLAAALALALISILGAAAGLHFDSGALAGVAIAVLAAHPIAAGLAAVVRPGRRATRRRSERSARIGGLLGLALTFAMEAPWRSVTTAAATALALAVAGLVAAIEAAAGGELRTTLFGQVVAVRLAPYHLLAAAAALFAAGALILDGALLTVERRLSLVGALRAVGWRSGEIRRLVTLESAMPALAAGLLAALLVGAAAGALGLGWASVLLALGVVVLAVVLAATATQLPAGLAVRAPPAATLRAEGASGIVAGFAPRQALLTVTALAVTVSLVAGGWGAAQAAATAPLPFVRPTAAPLSPATIRIENIVTALAAFSDREPGSASFEAALGYTREQMQTAGYDVRTHAYLSRRAEFLDSQGEQLDLPGIVTFALAFDNGAWDGRKVELPANTVDLTSSRSPGECPAGIAVLRIDGDAQAPLAQDMQARCLGKTGAVLAIHAADEAWAALTSDAARVRLQVGHFLTAASPEVAATPEAPWLIVTLDSTGPGATQSAAPTAVMLEIARRAVTEGLALRIAVASAGDGAAVSVLIERLAAEPVGPVLWLGPMGGPVAAVLGAEQIADLDRTATTAGLLTIAPIDGEFAAWRDRVTALLNEPTSSGLLAALSEQTGLLPGDEAGLAGWALAAGLDTAWLGEPGAPTVGPPSVAGTDVDTVAQVRAGNLEQLASGITAALRELER
jgi:putative ABC transport system permease protein